MPKGLRRQRYKDPLLTKQDLAHGTGNSTRTIERWIADGLPTRNVFGMVRMNQADAGVTVLLDLTNLLCQADIPNTQTPAETLANDSSPQTRNGYS